MKSRLSAPSAVVFLQLGEKKKKKRKNSIPVASAHLPPSPQVGASSSLYRYFHALMVEVAPGFIGDILCDVSRKYITPRGLGGRLFLIKNR